MVALLVTLLPLVAGCAASSSPATRFSGVAAASGISATSGIAAASGIGTMPPIPTAAPTPSQPTAEPRPTLGPSGSLAVELDDAGSKPTLLSSLHALGLRYLQPGTLALGAATLDCQDCDIAAGAGFSLVFAIQAAGPAGGVSGPPEQPSEFELRLHRSLVRWKPRAIVVEADVDDATAYTGSPAAYLEELSSACFQAHVQLVSCAGASLSPRALAELVVADKLDSGQPADALAYARSTIDPALSTTAALQAVLAKDAVHLARASAILAGLRSNDADYASVAWVGTDPDMLDDAVTYLRRVSRLPVIAARVGLTTTDEQTAARVVSLVKSLHLPLAVFDSTDGGRHGTRALFDPDGPARPSGKAFEAALQTP